MEGMEGEREGESGTPLETQAKEIVFTLTEVEEGSKVTSEKSKVEAEPDEDKTPANNDEVDGIIGKLAIS